MQFNTTTFQTQLYISYQLPHTMDRIFYRRTGDGAVGLVLVLLLSIFLAMGHIRAKETTTQATTTGGGATTDNGGKASVEVSVVDALLSTSEPEVLRSSADLSQVTYTVLCLTFM